MNEYKKTRNECCNRYNDFVKKHNIILTGFMGAGKSTVGKILARMLDMKLIETDEMIEQIVGMKIPKIFERYGENFFRDKESEVIQDFKSLSPGTYVISTGGGIVLRHDNIAALKEAGIIVFLEVGAEEVFCRLKEKNNRPLLQGGGQMEKIKSLLEQRKDLYGKADFRVSTEGKNPEELALEIVNLLKTRRRNG